MVASKTASGLGWANCFVAILVVFLALPVTANVDPRGRGWIELHRAANPNGPHEVDISIVPRMDFEYGSLVVVLCPYDSSSRFRDTIWEGGAHAGDTISQHHVLPVLESGRFSIDARIEFSHNAEGMLRPAGSPLFVQIEDTAVYTARGGFGPIDRRRIEAELQKMRPKLDSLGISEATFDEVGQKAPWILEQVQVRIGVVDFMVPARTFDSTGSPKTPQLSAPPKDSAGIRLPKSDSMVQDTQYHLKRQMHPTPKKDNSIDRTYIDSTRVKPPGIRKSAVTPTSRPTVTDSGQSATPERLEEVAGFERS